jgi:hypothetical protein
MASPSRKGSKHTKNGVSPQSHFLLVDILAITTPFSSMMASKLNLTNP